MLVCLLSQVNPKAGICPDFQKGYCPQGDACKLKHILEPTASTPGSGKRPTTSDEGEGAKRRRVVLRKGAVGGGGAGVTSRGEGGADASLWGAGRRNGSGVVSSTDRCERTDEDKEEEARIEAQVRQLLSEYAGQAGTSLVSVSYNSPALESRWSCRSSSMYQTHGLAICLPSGIPLTCCHSCSSPICERLLVSLCVSPCAPLPFPPSSGYTATVAPFRRLHLHTRPTIHGTFNRINHRVCLCVVFCTIPLVSLLPSGSECHVDGGACPLCPAPSSHPPPPSKRRRHVCLHDLRECQQPQCQCRR